MFMSDTKSTIVQVTFNTLHEICDLIWQQQWYQTDEFFEIGLSCLTVTEV